jgi:cellulose synthase operon protein C
VGGPICSQAYKEDAAKYVPLDPGLQAQVEIAAAVDPTSRSAQPSATRSGLTGGVRGDVEYAVTPRFRLGGLFRYDRTGDWNEARGMLFARYRFGE